MNKFLVLLVLGFGFACGHDQSAFSETIFLGPTTYLSAADSPFELSGLGETFFLEDFEDGELNTPGVTPFSLAIEDPIGVVTPPGIDTDSVDADDGVIDGFGNDGFSFTSRAVMDFLIAPPLRVMQIRFKFDRDALGFYPTGVGFAWTDGIPMSELVFMVTDSTGETQRMNWIGLGDETFAGTTDDDQFFGAVNPEGIGRVDIASAFFGSTDHESFEIDHLQYGLSIIPEPTTTTLTIVACFVIATFSYRRKEILLMRIGGCHVEV